MLLNLKLRCTRNSVSLFLGKLLHNKCGFCLALILAIFSYQALFFTLKTPFGVPPDEKFHYQQIINFKDNLLFLHPPLEAGIFAVRVAYANGSLYHVLLGKLITLVRVPEEHTLVFLRGCSLALGAVYFYFFFKLCKLLLGEKFLILAAFMIHTSILMFAFILGSVSYDNLVNCLGMLFIYHVFAFMKTHSYRCLLVAGVSAAAGCLVKVTLLPLVFSSTVILFVWFLGVGKAEVKTKINAYIHSLGKVDRTALFFFVLLFTINVYVNAEKLVRHGTLSPGCEVLFFHEKCLAEDHEYRTYFYLSHPIGQENTTRLSLLEYFWLWTGLMVQRVVGIFGHRTYSADDEVVRRIMAGLCSFYLWAIFHSICRFSKVSSYIWISLISFTWYLLTLFYYGNYQGYVVHGDPSASVQGRYIFPVISLLVISLVYSIRQSLGMWLGYVVLVIISAYLMYNGFPAYLSSNQRFDATIVF